MNDKADIQAHHVEQGAGNAVADLRAGYGQADGYAEPAAGTARHSGVLGQMTQEVNALVSTAKAKEDEWAEQVEREREDRNYWQHRARRAETALRAASSKLDGVMRLLADWRQPGSDDVDRQRILEAADQLIDDEGYPPRIAFETAARELVDG